VAEVGEHYRRVRLRLTDFLRGVDDDDWSVPVAACPGWSVQDVLGHLVGIVEDVTSRRLAGPPDDSQTAAQVERHRDDDPRELLDRWAELAVPFEKMVTAVEAWPPALDVLAHEQDIRTALGRPGGRDDELFRIGARRLIESVRVDGTVTVDLGDEIVRSAQGQKPEESEGPDYRLQASPFEVFRVRCGRRTRDQVAALDWSRDPDAILDDLFLFGPARAPLVE
jgi:uncharacterized protein (TIGR03083 family)